MIREDERLIAQRANTIVMELVEKKFKGLLFGGPAITGIRKLGFQLLTQMVTELVAVEVETGSNCGGIYGHLSDLLNSIHYVAKSPDGELQHIGEGHLKIALMWLRDNGFITISTDNPDDWDYDTWATIVDWTRKTNAEVMNQ